MVYLSNFVSPDAQGNALYSLRTSLGAAINQLTDWNPDLVNPCTWSKITCDTNNNVITVAISDMGFSGTLSSRIGILKTLNILYGVLFKKKRNGITGEIPQEVGNLTSLTMLNLENNHLTGEIPASLGSLKRLSFLILNENNLSGSIPESLSSLSNLSEIQLANNRLSGEIPPQLFPISSHNFTGNQLNCGINFSHPCASQEIVRTRRKSKTGMIVGIVVASLFILLLGYSLVFLLWRRRNRNEVFVDVAGEVDRRIEFGQLKRFSWRELQICTNNFDEKNVLGQGGFGKESFTTHWLLVYPFMENLSVASRWRELKPGEPVLNWATRKQVALGTSRGLEYLHEHCNPKIIHRDVKAANVLLDEDFEAVVGDFGLAKLVDVRRTNVTTQVRELVTGQRAIDFSRLEDQDDVLLLDHVKKLQREKKLDEIVDPNLSRNYDIQEVEMMIQVALLCTQSSPEDRPKMSEVVRMLEGEGLTERWQLWQHVEITRMQEYDRLQRRFNWDENSIYNEDAIELSGGR
ncbi:hypothetical protein ABFS83_05G095500 [Erythranthe nasuta]